MNASATYVDFVFQGIGLERTARNAKVVTPHVSWNYTTYLNVVFLAFGALLLWRYFRLGGGGFPMLKMMDKPMNQDHDHHGHHHHDEHAGCAYA